MVVKAGKGRKRQPAALVPDGLATKWQQMVTLLADRMFNKRKALKQAVGSRPYRGVPMDEGEREAQIRQMLSDRGLTLDVISKNLTVDSGGRVRINRALAETLSSFHKKRQVPEEMPGEVVDDHDRSDPTRA